MSVSYTLKSGAWVACLSCMLTGLAQAQLQRQPGQTPTERQPGRQFDRQTSQTGEASSEVEKFLASCLLAKNKAEIEISQIASEEAQDQQVKQFAEKMVREHRELSQKLEQVAGPQMAQRDTQPGRDTDRQPGQQNQQLGQQNQPGAGRNQDLPGRQADPLAQRGSQNEALQQLTRIEQQITQKATEAVKQSLRDKQDRQFDQAYLGCQVGSHMHMKAALEVIEQHTSGQLSQIAQQAKSKVEQHLQEAEQLMEQAQRGARQAARQPGDRLE